MPVTINGSTGITDADGGTVLSTADFASQAQAVAGTDNTTIITPLRVRDALNASGSAPTYACRAWVNFNGTGTVAIRASGNVSSITDGGVGTYTVNFNTAMPDANYSVVASSHFSATATRGSVFAEPYASTASSCVVVTSASASSFDCASVTVAVFR